MNFKGRLLIVVYILDVTAAGFGMKLYSGPGRDWLNNYGAGVLYEIFWILIFYFVSPTARTVNFAPGIVFGLTCALEFLQLNNSPVLESIRATFLGRTLIGTDFVWLDFPHYLLGCFLGFIILKIHHGRTDAVLADEK